jgi:two-component system phosphate regulon sensor histidine kinase PhoR
MAQDHAAREALIGLVDALDVAAIVVDAGDAVVAANAAAREIAPALRVGAQLAMALRAPQVLDALAQARAAAAAQTAQWRERGAVERMIAVRVAPLASAPGALALTLSDLTEAHRLERMRSDFVANASHELRTPLASLLGFIETLQGPAREDAAARARFLDIMRAQAARMSRLIDDLLSLSRIEQRAHVRPRDAVDLADVARHVVETLGPLAARRGATIALAAEPAVVAGDRDELVRMTENLVENALKYGVDPASGATRVEVGVSAEGRDARLSVRDFGPGVAPEHLPRLTERFYRVDPGKSRAEGGTGLGLALVKHVAARHGGRLTVTSRLGEGAAFAVAIPLRSSD